jgi:stearoyl-CoA desaturase (delta-9 desaturase)
MVKRAFMNNQTGQTRLRLLGPLGRWFVNPGSEEVGDGASWRIDWLRAVPYLAMHVLCLSVIWVGWSWTAVGVAAFLYGLRVFALTGFFHRYFAHRAFKTSRVCQFLFGLLGCTAVQRGPLWWAAHHRHHHAHSDDESDLHSPVQYSFLFSHTGWFLTPAADPVRWKMIPDLARYPELRFLDRFDLIVHLLFAAGLYGLGALLEAFAPGLGTNGMQMLVWGFFISTVLVYHVTFLVNSLAHRWGSRRYPTRDDSRNNLLVALLTFGEGWHNNHHRYPACARQGFRWWEVDVTYYLLVMMSWLGLIWDLKPVPRRVVEDRSQGSEEAVEPVGNACASVS